MPSRECRRGLPEQGIRARGLRGTNCTEAMTPPLPPLLLGLLALRASEGWGEPPSS